MKNTLEAIKPLWDNRQITNMGQYHKELEEKLKGYLDVQELSLMVNGHMALELAIQLFDFPEGAEVITTPFTFISTTHAIVRNHLQPVFCDVKRSDGTMDETKIRESDYRTYRGDCSRTCIWKRMQRGRNTRNSR